MSYRLAEQIYTNSLVSQEYLKGVIRVTRGSSAGYPLADLVYSLAMARVLLSLRSTLADAGLQSSVSLGGVSMVAHETSFVDDVAQPILGPASTISNKVAQTTTKVFEVFAAFSLEVNFNPGKTESIVNFVGDGSKAARAQLFAEGSRIPLPDIGPGVHLNIVESYKHVGTQCSVSAQIRNEVTTRINVMSAESRSLRKVLRKATLPINP